jgi:hypothetical protein
MARDIDEILALIESNAWATESLHPDARADWTRGDNPADTPDWACQICGKPGGH